MAGVSSTRARSFLFTFTREGNCKSMDTTNNLIRYTIYKSSF